MTSGKSRSVSSRLNVEATNMGCCSSSFKPNSQPGQGANAMMVASKFQFTQHDLDGLYRLFKRCDAQRDGTVNVDEFCVMSNLEDQEKLTAIVFRQFDKDHSDALDFTEMMCAIYSVCSCDRPNLAHLVFELFDADGGGAMDRGEVKMMLKLLYNMRPPKAVEVAVSHFDNSRDGKIDAKEFVAHALHNEVLLVPLFNMQMTLRKLVLGTERWESLTRARTSKHATSSIFSLLGKSDADAKQMKAASLVMAHNVASAADPSELHPEFETKAQRAKQRAGEIKAARDKTSREGGTRHKRGGKVAADN